MKKVMSIIAVALFTATFVSCGPSAEEKAKMEEAAKRANDSVQEAITNALNAEVDTTVAAPAPAVEEKH
jgi:hypothetical protein